MADLKAVPTRFMGCKFRSRLEARWGVFFHTLGLEWEYEPEGFDLGEFGWYLPDFRVDGCWIEIKGAQPSDAEMEKVAAFSKQAPIVVFRGNIAPPRFIGYYRNGLPRNLVGSWALGIGKPMDGSPPLPASMLTTFGRVSVHPDHRPLCWQERLQNVKGHERHGGFVIWPVPASEPCEAYDNPPTQGQPLRGAPISSIPGVEFPMRDFGVRVFDPLAWGVKSLDSPALLEAYKAARGARFEHGESG